MLPACIFIANVCLYWCKIITTGLIPHDWTTCLSVRKEGSQKALRHYFLRQTTMCLECPWLPRGFVPNTFPRTIIRTQPCFVPLWPASWWRACLLWANLKLHRTWAHSAVAMFINMGMKRRRKGLYHYVFITMERNSWSRSPCNWIDQVILDKWTLERGYCSAGL